MVEVEPTWSEVLVSCCVTSVLDLLVLDWYLADYIDLFWHTALFLVRYALRVRTL